ncbi:hypothetical protein LTR53_005191, partial [Teratosphaeriaceae sp. CCFEE 6253]
MDAIAQANAKRRRLNAACQYCRSRKTRCDENQPSCHACSAAGIPCVTTDGRRPGWHVERREAGRAVNRLLRTWRSAERPDGAAAAAPTTTPPVPPAPSLGQYTLLTPKSAIATEGIAHTFHASETSGGRQDDDQPPSESTDAAGFELRLPMLSAGRSTPSTTLEWLTDWLDLACRRQGTRTNYASMLATTSRHAPQLPTFPTKAPNVPERGLCQTLIDDYFSKVNVVYPLLEVDRMQKIMNDTFATQLDGRSRGRTELEAYMLLLLASCLGADSRESHPVHGFVAECIEFCKSMLGHVMGHASLDAIHVVFLLALLLKQRDDISAAWPVIGVCVSMANGLGLNRSGNIQVDNGVVSPSRRGHKRLVTWWSIYCLERLAAFELGRASSIADEDCSSEEPSKLPHLIHQ